jgi:Pilin (bacterial filament)
LIAAPVAVKKTGANNMKKILMTLLLSCAIGGYSWGQDAAKPSAADIQAHNLAISKALAAATPVKTAVEEFRRHSGRLPSTNADVGMNPPATYGNYDVKQIAVGNDGVIEITLTASSGVDDGIIRLTPKPSPIKDENSLEWTCASASFSTISDATGGVCEYTNQP